MNLNELLINRGRGRGKKFMRNKNYTDMGPPLAPPVKKKDYTPSSDLNWGQSHISAPNTSSTHRSAGSSKISSDEDSRVIVALTEGRGEARCEVGMAVVNVSKPLLVLCQISDTQSYVNTLTKINIFNPQEILVPATFVENFSGNRLIDKVKERFPGIRYTGCPRSTFNKANGMDILSGLCIPSFNAILLVLEHRYYALAAASALITYVQDNLFVYYAAGSIKIDYQESEGYAIIDVSTADRLELVCSAKPAQGNKYSSLFGVLNHCATKIGSRTLRSSILQPPCKVQYIEERLDAVTELIKHPEMLLSIQALLQKVANIDLLLSIATLVPDDPQKCSYRQLNYILLLNTLIDLIAPLKEVLSKSTHRFFVRLTKTLGGEEFSAIKDIVRNTVQENAHPAKGQAAVMQRCFAIKPGLNGLLDLVRKTYSERLDDMREYVKKLAEKYDLALTLGNNQTKGHHIVLNLNQKQKRYMKKSDLPEEFIEVYRLAGSFTMKTPELVNLSTRLDDIMADILRISNVMVHSIIVEIKKYITLFYKLCEEIAQLDVLQSLAECSVRNGYVRPKFGDFTEITHARHPLLDFLLSTKPVANPISCSADYNLHIITGPNGSGKSIFIRQVVLLQVMAQVGCYVPAQAAIFRPADRLYARIYLEDNMEHGASSFILEMKEIKYIMTTMTKNSLVIIDELCRSTCLEEGTALAIAIVEKLAQSSAFIYITTHFTLLTKLYEMYLNVKVWQLETIPSGEDPRTFKLDFRHNLVPGVTSVKRYGVYIVRNIWPDSILRYVDTLLENISKKPKRANIVSLDEKIRLKYQIESQFRRLKSQRKLTISEVNKLLNQYQNELEKLGYHADVVPLPLNYPQDVPRIEHSIFGEMPNLDSAEDLRITSARMKQHFTPEPSFSSQLSNNLAEVRMQAVFTPEPSQQSLFTNCMNQTCPNLDFYRTHQERNDENYARDELFERYQHQDLQNSSNGNMLQNYGTGEDNYENISRFIAENSENIHKLIPEVNLSYGEMSRSGQNTFTTHPLPLESEDIRQKVGDLPTSKGSKQTSSLDVSTDVNEAQFSVPLQNNATKTSTPVPRGTPEVLRASPAVRIYGSDRRNFSTSSTTNDQNRSFHKNDSAPILDQMELDGFDLESIQEDLEACSRIFGDDDDFEEESLNTTYKSIPSDNTKLEERVQPELPKEKHEHVIPVVTVIEGPNNATLSFDEDDFKDIPKDNQVGINIISDIVVVPKKTIQPRKEEDNNCFNISSSGGDEQVISSTKQEYKLEEINASNKQDYDTNQRYKSFDSTFNATKIITDQSYQSCKSDFETDPVRQLSNLRQSEGYEISTIDDSGKFVTLSSPDKENSIVKNEVYSEGKAVDQPERSSSNKTKTTNLSFASKVRKLDQSSRGSSQQKEDEAKKTSSDKTITSVSSASKKRNLDQPTTDSTSPNEKSDSRTRESDKLESSSSLKESDEDGKPKPEGQKRKFSAPRTKSAGSQSESTDGSKTKRCAVNRKKFVPPRRLTSREIKEEFKEQDRKILESSPNSSNFSKYLQQLIQRPTVQQVRQTTHLAMIRKTEEGVEVIPATPPRKKAKTEPWKKRHSSENFNMSIFSDKNALPFEHYLNSDEKDYKTFSFNFNKDREEEQKFQFAPTTLSFGEYTSNSVTERFVRHASETMGGSRAVGNGEEVQNITFCVSQRSVNKTLTPDGFYKQNKDDINRIMSKYMRDSSQKSGIGSFSGNFNGGRSIFDNYEVDSYDLNI